jgi:hypothetical protein
MSTLNLQRFTNVGTLRAIHPELLARLLTPYQDFLLARGVTFPPTGSDEPDYQNLAHALMHPDENTPHDLAEALFYINEMSTPDTMELLLEEVAERNAVIHFHPESTPEDVAIQLWLLDPGLVERKHAERFLTNSKSFEYFQSAAAPRALGAITQSTLDALAQDLDDWFVEKRRGRTSKVFAYPRDEETWFLVRHGDPYKREGGIKDGESTSVFYRPETFDVVIYNHTLGEIRLNANTIGIKSLYRRQFGRHLFGDEDLFPDNGPAKYTLEPLRSDGQSAMVCSDIEGLDWVRLQELQISWGGPFHEVEIRRASDLLAAFAAKDRPIHAHARMVCAKFKIKFSNAKTPRILTLRPPNIASFTRDGDSVLGELWLANRGFVLEQPVLQPAAYHFAPDETINASQSAALV